MSGQLEALQAQGCGAYVGEKACGAPVTGDAHVGSLTLMWRTRNRALLDVAGDRPTVVAFLCSAHSTPESLVADASPALRLKIDGHLQKLGVL